MSVGLGHLERDKSDIITHNEQTSPIYVWVQTVTMDISLQAVLSPSSP